MLALGAVFLVLLSGVKVAIALAYPFAALLFLAACPATGYAVSLPHERAFPLTEQLASARYR